MHLRSFANTSVCDQFKQGRWSPALIHKALEQAESRQQATDWLAYLDICQSIRGITLQEWLHVAERANANSANSPKLLLRLFYLIQTPGIIENLDETERHRYLDIVKPSSRHQLFKTLSDIRSSGYLGCRLSHYPGLLESLTNEVDVSRRSERWCFGQEKLAAQLSERTTLFNELTRKILPNHTSVTGSITPIRIAVVGNSPTILHREQGNEIDSADLVIRFNNASIEQHTVRCTGKRTDIWVMSPSTPVSQCPVDARTVIVSGLNSLTRPSFYWKKLVGLNRPLSQFPSHIWYQLIEHFHAPPSAGTLLIATLEEQTHIEEICCYGFSTNQTDCEKHSNHHADSHTRSDRHNWIAEIEWLTHRSTQSKAFIVPSQ